MFTFEWNLPEEMDSGKWPNISSPHSHSQKSAVVGFSKVGDFDFWLKSLRIAKKEFKDFGEKNLRTKLVIIIQFKALF